MTHAGSTGPCWQLTSLTPAGHDFAESARTQFIWVEVMGAVRDKGLASASLDVIKRLADKYVRKHLELD